MLIALDQADLVRLAAGLLELGVGDLSVGLDDEQLAAGGEQVAATGCRSGDISTVQLERMIIP